MLGLQVCIGVIAERGMGGEDLLAPFDAGRIRASAVSTRINSVRNNDEACIRPIE